MPTYEITAPNGKRFRVTAPAGASQDEVLRYAQQQFSRQKPAAAPQQSGGEMATEGMGMLGRLVAATGRGATEVGQGGRQMVNRAMPPELLFFGSDEQLAKANQNTADYDAKVREEARLFDQGLGQTGAGKVGQVLGNVIATAPLGALGAGVRGAAAAGAAAGALQPVTGEGDFGADKVKQIVVGALTGFGVDRLMKAGKITAGAVKAGAERLKTAFPKLTQEGRERMAAQVLREFAADPANLAKAANPRQFVPGTQPTLAEAADDVGLAGLQRTLQNTPEFNTRFAQIQQGNNAARVDAIRQGFGGANEGAAQAIEAARDKATLPLLQAARKVQGVNTQPVISLADKIIKDRKGRPAVQGAVQRVRDLLAEEGMDSVQRLHNARQAIGDMLSGMSPESEAAKAASRELMAIKRRLDVQIGKASPEFRQFLTQYADMSKEAGRVRMGDELLGKSFATLDATGNPILSPAQFGRAADNLDQVARQATGFRRQTADKLMTPDQRDTVGAIRQDLDRYARTQSGGRAPGSPTVQNAVGAGRLQDAVGGSEVLGAVLPGAGGPLAVFNAVKNAYGQKVLDVVQEAMLNPQEAARILAKLPAQQQQAARQVLASPQIRALLSGASRAVPIAAASGAAQAQQP
jgi:hypothetical protein